MKFRLRTIFAITVLCALLGRWYGGEYARYWAERATVDAIRERGLKVVAWDHRPRLVDWFSTVRRIELTGRIEADVMEQLRTLKGLHMLDLIEVRVSDEAWRNLASFPNIAMLYITDTPISDEQIVMLNGMTSLRCLTLQGTDVTDAGATRLRELLPQLEILDD